MGRSHKAIFSSSALIGTQQAIRLAIGVAQTKAIAALLGTSGTGLFGIYAALMNFAQTLAGMGLAGSGVRQIARAHGAGDDQQTGRSIQVLLVLSLAAGILGSLTVFAGRRVLSRMTFGDGHHAGTFGILAWAIGPAVLTAGMLAVLQGLRRLKALALASVLAALAGSAAVVGLVFRFREAAVAPAFVAAAWSGLLLVLPFVFHLPRPGSPPRRDELRREVRELSGLGLAFMVKGTLLALSAYLLRLLAVRELGLEAAGLYHASWMLAMFLPEILLQAMATDFFPRLSAESGSRKHTNVLLGEQVESGMLVIGPVLLLLMALAPLALRWLYAPDFVPAARLLQWMLLGTLIRIGGWSLAFLPLAWGRSWLSAGVETASTLFLLGFSAAGLRWRGLEGLGIGFSIAALFSTGLLWGAGRRLTGFAWSRSAAWTLGAGLALAGAACAVLQAKPDAAGTDVALALAGVAVLGSLARVRRLLKTTDAHPSTPSSKAIQARASVAIVVPHWNALAMTADCCRRLAAQAYPDARIFIVDNGSTAHAPAALAAACPAAEIVRLDENRGYAGAANAGIRAALRQMDAGFVWLLNNDLMCEPDTLAKLILAAGREPGAGIVGCDLNEGGPGAASFRRLRAAKKLGPPFFIPADAPADAAADYLCGASLLIRRELLDEIGGFDESFFFFFEDADFCARARRAGWTLAVAADALPGHYGSATIGKLGRMQARCYRAGQVRYVRKYSNWPHLAAWPCFVLRLAVDSVRGRGAAVRGNLEGWREGWAAPDPALTIPAGRAGSGGLPAASGGV